MMHLTEHEKQLLSTKNGFDHGWSAALDEVILIAGTVLHQDGSADDIVTALLDFRDTNS